MTKISKIKKRDGRIVDFDKDKIAKAIWKAAESVGGEDRTRSKELAEIVAKELEKRYEGNDDMPTVEEVQDIVEKTLIEERHATVAKSYILYRQKRTDVRKIKSLLGVEDELKMSLNAIKVMASRYLLKDENLNIIESTDDLFKRVAKAIAEPEKKYGGEEKTKEYEEKFYDIMTKREFMPNSPTLMNAGTEIGQLSACFVLPVEDSIRGIFEAVKQTAIIHKSGGGTGFSFARLRPKGDVVKSTGGIASGPLSFMQVFNSATEVIKQGGKRRGANMGILRVDHPDILEFITSKEKEGKLSNFNISITATDEFMRAVETNSEYSLKNPRTTQPAKKMPARAVFNLMVMMAWKNGEPGMIFIDRVNEKNPTPHVGEIESTNPCVVGDTIISTENGLERIKDIVKKYPDGGFKISTDNRIPIVTTSNGNTLLMKQKSKGTSLRTVSNTWDVGNRDVFKIVTKSGYELMATPDHKIMTNNGWVKTKDLIPNKHKVFIQSGTGCFNKDKKLPFEPNNMIKGRNGRTYSFNLPSKWSKELGITLGWLIGDGWLRDGDKNCRVGFSFGKEDKEVFDYLKPIVNHMYGKDIKEVERENEVIHLSYHSKFFVNFFKRLGVKAVKADKKIVPEALFTAPKEAVIGFIQGLFTADGTVRNSRKSSSDWVALSSKSKKLLKDVQMLLLNLGIRSVIFDRSRPRRDNLFEYVNIDGEKKTYGSDGILYEIGIFGSSLDKFKKEIGFISRHKINSLNNIRYKKRRSMKFVDDIESVEHVGKRKVFDLTEPLTHSMICNCLVVHQCGEQPLLPWESCNLGSINLEKMMTNGDIDWDKLRETVRLAVRFLDNVIDVNKYPIKEIEEMTKSNRKIGLGVMGFADLLIKMKIKYDSQEAINLAQKIMKFIQDESKKMSEELGKEKGSFQNFKGSKLDGKYEHMRNATTTTIAPTGTISVISNCSSGIEPIFAVSYIRDVSDSLGHELIEINNNFETMMIEREMYTEELIKKISQRGSIQNIGEIPEDVRDIFVTALDIEPEWHVRIQAAFQKYVDNAVSKTINFPMSATPHDVEKAFLLAWKLGCKGITVYRYGSREKQVLNISNGNKSSSEPKKAKLGEALGGCPNCHI